ncbi:MAG: deoxyribonuclease IV [Candidatus Cloacimonetes bacterium 4572_55]|nr:MAG: deoxyribonuclease IV [Candidatus Cloacimonetes bacterium 4572_55]
MPIFGAHVSTSGGVSKAPGNGAAIGCEAIQIFSKNQRQWRTKSLSEKEIAQYHVNLEKSGIHSVIVHDSYLINLCSPKKETYQKSLVAFKDELDRTEVLGIPYLVFHPGSHLKKGEDWGVRVIADSLNVVHDQTAGYQTVGLLETTAGQGTNIGYRFEQLRQIIDLSEHPERLGVCFDTCHVFAAGYDLRSDYDKVWEEFGDVVGFDRLKAFHLNDSKKELGSRVDRHEQIGEGCLGIEPFRRLVNDSRFQGLPMILETPGGDDMYRHNLQILRGLVDSPGKTTIQSSGYAAG